MKVLYLPLKKEWYEMIERGVKREEYREMKAYWQKRLTGHIDAVRFSYGYTQRRMTFECASITIGRGRPEWGAPEEDVFIIKIGNRL